MPLTSPKFIITTSYGTASIIAYIIVGITILRYRKRFSGSFFTLYLAQSFFNCVTYLNTMITLRLPQNTCGDCLLAPFFNQTHFWGLEIFHTIHFHMGYTQYFMIAIVSANRLTMMLFPFSFEKHWRKITLPSILVAAFTPLLATSTIFLHKSSYWYVELMDCFATRNTTDMGSFYKILIVFMVAVTFISVILNIWTIVLLICIRRLQKDKSTRKSEKMLVLHSFVNFAIMLIACLITVFNLYGVTDSNRDSWYAFAGQLLLPFVSDSLTLLSPFLLIMCCSALRTSLFGGILNNSGQMPLTSPKFIITTSYGTASIIAYIIVGITILRYRKRFSGSFFTLYLAQSFFNCVTYLNTMITLRLPQKSVSEFFQPEDKVRIKDNLANIQDMGSFYKILIVFMVAVTFISVILNIWTIVLLICIRRLQKDKSTRKSEKMLVLHSFVNFAIMLIACLITVFNLYGVTDSNRDSWYAFAGQLLLPFVSDSLTLLSPFLLIMCCSALRTSLFGGILNNSGQVSIVVPTNTRSTR